MTDNKEKLGTVLAVVGPTASGKTALAVELALKHEGEIISCDSVQVYRGMDIGSAKVTAEEARGVPHHMLDIASPSSDFSCADYAAEAERIVIDIFKRGKTPIFCGGTGLYLDSVLKNTAFSTAGRDDAYREDLEGSYTREELHAMLAAIDPRSAEAIHPNNVKRVIRAIEIYRVTGVTKSEWDRRSREQAPPFESITIGLNFHSREVLYSRIDRRVDTMLEMGLLEEVKALDCAAFRASTASQGIGYKELLSFIDGKCTLDAAVEEIKKASRNYAKRQLTWFGRDKNVEWIYVDDARDVGSHGAAPSEYISEQAEKILKKRGFCRG